MTTQEFSDNFDTLLNSYGYSKPFGSTSDISSIELNEYEKSVFLTLAQDNLVKSYYSGKNQFGDSFEKTEEVRRYLDSLVSSISLSPITNSNIIKINSSSKLYEMPTGLWFIIYEEATIDDTTVLCINEKNIKVIPVTHDEYYRLYKNPFRTAGKDKILRVDVGGGYVELISKYNISTYILRYIEQPSPIILTDIGTNTIGGLSTVSECNLHEALHQQILEGAVNIAIQRFGLIKNNV